MLRGAVVAPAVALPTVVCSCVGWLSHGGPGITAVCPVVNVPRFGFRVCQSVWWLSVVLCEDVGTSLWGVAEGLGAWPAEHRT